MDAWHHGGHRDSDFYFHEKEKCEIIKTLNMSGITQNQKSMKKFYDDISEKYDLIFSLSPLHKTFFAEEIKGKKVLCSGDNEKIKSYFSEISS